MQIDNFLKDCIPIHIAAKRYALNTYTLRLWLRENRIAGVKVRPYKIHEGSLQRYLKSRFNQPMNDIYTLEQGKDDKK